MKTIALGLTLLSAAAGTAGYTAWPEAEGAKVLVLNSYHQGHPWSDDVTKELSRSLRGRGVDLSVHHMRMSWADSLAAMTDASRRARSAIEAYRPDVLVTLDDSAMEQVVAPFYRDRDLPVVFAGVHWDSARFGMNKEAVTAITNSDPLFALLDVLNQFSGGSSVAFLAGDTQMTRRTLKFYRETLGVTFQAVKLVKTFAEWQDAYRDLQNHVDVLYLHDVAGINGWDGTAAAQFAQKNAVVPSGSINAWMAPLALFVVAKDARDHAAWAARATLSILDGRSLGSVQKAKSSPKPVTVNAGIAKTLLMEVPESLLPEVASIN